MGVEALLLAGLTLHVFYSSTGIFFLDIFNTREKRLDNVETGDGSESDLI